MLKTPVIKNPSGVSNICGRVWKQTKTNLLSLLSCCTRIQMAVFTLARKNRTRFILIYPNLPNENKCLVLES